MLAPLLASSPLCASTTQRKTRRTTEQSNKRAFAFFFFVGSGSGAALTSAAGARSTSAAKFVIGMSVDGGISAAFEHHTVISSMSQCTNLTCSMISSRRPVCADAVGDADEVEPVSVTTFFFLPCLGGQTTHQTHHKLATYVDTSNLLVVLALAFKELFERHRHLHVQHRIYQISHPANNNHLFDWRSALGRLQPAVRDELSDLGWPAIAERLRAPRRQSETNKTSQCSISPVACRQRQCAASPKRA
jgi:hypothetical protein